MFRRSIVPLFLVLLLCGCAANPGLVKIDRSKGYVINGKTYHPMKAVKVGYKQDGIASWYGPGFHGRKTASGEIYDMNEMTAAHSELPLNTLLRVTNLNNRRQVLVRVNDRGPFVADRVLDMSFAAAKNLGMVTPGTVPVKLEVIGASTRLASAPKKKPKTVASRFPKSPNPYLPSNQTGFLALLRN